MVPLIWGDGAAASVGRVSPVINVERVLVNAGVFAAGAGDGEKVTLTRRSCGDDRLSKRQAVGLKVNPGNQGSGALNAIGATNGHVLAVAIEVEGLS